MYPRDTFVLGHVAGQMHPGMRLVEGMIWLEHQI